MSGRVCGHREGSFDLFAQVVMGGELYDATKAVGPNPIAWRCQRCGEYASLGPAKNTEWIEYEIRAAEMAIERLEEGEPFGTDRFESCPAADESGLCDVCQWIYLARCIADHTEAK